MKRLTAALLAAAALLAGLTPLAAQPGATDDVKAVVRGNNQFAFDMYAHVRGQDGNLFFSPYSISTALGMTYAGARGRTEEQMGKTLHFGLPPEQLFPAMGDVEKALASRGRQATYRLNIANALWGQRGFHFLPDFLKLTNDYYGAGLKELDFEADPEKARMAINDWVEEKTQDKIQDLIPPNTLKKSTRLVLTNAIYFKAAWLNEFQELATKPMDFHVAADKTVKVPTMTASHKASLVQTDDLQMLELPYQGYDLSMLVLLPRQADGLAQLEKQLSGEQLEKWLSGRRTYLVDIHLPKWKFTSQYKLKDVLSEMGMPLAFSDDADFSGMSTEERLKIDQVIHKAFVDVNEKGTEAAAATAVVVVGATAVIQPPPRATFRADHPFLFVIRHNPTGSILFLGRVSNPAE